MHQYPKLILKLSLAFFLILITPVFAQSVTVKGGAETGHGFLIKHGSTCYLVTPKHVTKGKHRATVFSSAPVVHSGASIEEPFWDGLDLAVGVVRGPVEERCTSTLADFAATAPIRSGQQAELVIIRPSGDFDRVDMIITRSDYLTINARFLDADPELFKGISGAFLFSDDKPIGMVLKALSPTEGQFMRIEEIYMNLERRLNRQIGFSQMPDETAKIVAEKANGLPFIFQNASIPPLNPDLDETNLDGVGAYVFTLTRPNRIAFRVEGTRSVELSRIRIQSDVDGEYALPRGLQIDVSSALDGARPRPFLSGNMSEDGVFDKSRAPSVVRWVFVTVTSGWDSGPIGIESVLFN